MRDQPTPDQPDQADGSDDRSGSEPEDTGTAPAWSQVPGSDPDGHPRDSEPTGVPDGAEGVSAEWDADEDAAADDDVPAVNPRVRRIVVHPAETPRRRIAPWERRRAPVPSGTPVTVTAAPATPGDIGAEPVGPEASRGLRLADLRGDLLRGPRDRFVARLAHAYWSVVAMGPRVLVHPVTVVLYATLVALLLRVFRISTNPPGLNQDEALAGYDAYSLLHTLRDHHGNSLTLVGFQSFGDWVSPFLNIWLMPFIAAFGLDVVAVRLGTVTLGVLAIPFTFLLVRELTGRAGTGAAAACFLAISPWAVHLSRFAIPPATVVPLLALALWLTVRAFRVRTTPAVTLAGLAAGLLVIGYPTMKLYVPLLILLVLAIYLRSVLTLPIRAIAGGIVAFLLVAGPSYLAYLLDPAMSNRQQYVSVLNRDDFSPGFFIDQYWHYISPNFLFAREFVTDLIKGESFNAEPGYGVELAWTAPFLVIGLLAVLIRALDYRLPFATRRPALLVIGAILCAPITGALTYPMNSSRNAQLALLLAVLAGIGLVSLVDLVRATLGDRGWAAPSVVRRFAPLLLVAILLVPLGVEARGQYRGYFMEWPRTFGAQYFFHSGLEGAMAYAASVEDQYDEIWVTATNQGYMFLLFYDRVDPVIVHEQLRTTTQGFVGYHVEQLDQYRFTRPYFGPPDDLDLDDVDVVYESFPSGSGRGYVVWQITRDDGRRILVIQDRVR